MKLLLLAFATIFTLTFAYHDPAKPHRDADGFRNNYPHTPKQGFWRWKWDQLRDGLPATPEGGYRFDTAKPQLAKERKKAGLADDAFLVLRHGETRVLR